MFPCLSAELPQKKPKNPTKLPAEAESKQSLPRTTDSFSHSNDLLNGLKEWQIQLRKEKRYITLVVMIPLAILLLPAIALLLYLIFNPDDFMYVITPE